MRSGRALSIALLVAVMASACGGSATEPTPSPTPTSPPIVAKGRIAFITTDAKLALIGPNGGDLHLLTDAAGVKGFQWAPDGSMLAVETSSSAAGEVLRVISSDGGPVFDSRGSSSPVWSPSDGRLAAEQGTDVVVYDATGQEIRRVESAVRPAWSPDGASLAVVRLGANGQGVPVIVDVATGDEMPLSPGIEPHAPDFPIAWRPAGGVVAYRDKVYELADGAVKDLPGTAVEWNPDGRMLMVTLEFKPADNATPAQLLDFTQGGKPVIGLDVRPAVDGTPAWLFVKSWTDWSPDGRLLLYLDPQPARLRVRMYDTVAITQKIFKDIQGERPDISPDGTHVAFMKDGEVWVLALDGSALRDITPGGYPAWQPQSP